jgi:hypothetical protein
MARKKYQKKYGCDMQVLLGALASDNLAAFVAGLAAGAPDAVERFEQARAALTKPRRVCVELFLCEGETFENIARSTGYLVDDVPVHIAAGVRQCVPEASEASLKACAVGVLASQEPQSGATPGEGLLIRDAHGASSLAPDSGGVRPTSSGARLKKPIILWLIAAAVIAGVYIYMKYYSANRPAPVPVAPARPAVVSDTLVETQPATDSVSMAKPAGRASIVRISRGEDGEYVSVPLIGRRQYNEYLTSAMMPLDSASRGEVTMTFRVNNFGHPSEIRANSGLTHEANHEAIRLLTGGPEWSVTDRQVSLTIKFE